MGKYTSDKVRCEHLHIKLTKSRDTELISFLDMLPNKQRFVKNLILTFIRHHERIAPLMEDACSEDPVDTPHG